MSACSKRAEQNEEESATLVALAVEGDCVLDFYLERDSYDSGQSKTNEVFSVLIDGRPGQTYAINNPFQLIGASLSEPHIDELNVRNPYIIMMFLRPSPAGRHRHCTSMRDYTSVRNIFLLAA